MIELETQQKFSRMVPRLIDKAHELGFEVVFGDAYRDPRVTYGHPNSLHRHRLAIDLLLFRDGEWLQDTDDYVTLGEWWESIGGVWGGRFEDGNHFSLAFGGMK
jgi:hypothetical protein